MLAGLLVHVVACTFWMSARLRGFRGDTWVYNRGDFDMTRIRQYSNSMYWAFQTLTTVGYGDFGAYNN